MKKRIISVLVVIILLLFVLCVATSCQSAAKSFGGTVTLNLEPGKKLEEITWKDDFLWYLSLIFRKQSCSKEDETAETHTFQQSSEWGVFEGKVIEHEKGTQK